ncbi:MAG: hypothetical protein KDB26_07560 [Microthrixaceae bacterium]|nr:hypothetical protein [Microthrixaceae bacterium]
MSSSRSDDRLDPNAEGRGMDSDGDYLMPESDEIIRRVMAIIESSPSMPMSSSVRVNKDEVLEMLEDALERLPVEVREAKWLLKDRDAFLAERQREGDTIVEKAAANAARLVEKREVVKNAQSRAEEILDDAERNARRRRREADDYCDQQLARYENALVKLHRQVGKMRDRLAAPSVEESELGAAAQKAARSPKASGGPRTGQTKAVPKRAAQQRPSAPPKAQARPARPRPTKSEPPADSGHGSRPIVFDQDE